MHEKQSLVNKPEMPINIFCTSWLLNHVYLKNHVKQLKMHVCAFLKQNNGFFKLVIILFLLFYLLFINQISLVNSAEALVEFMNIKNKNFNCF